MIIPLVKQCLHDRNSDLSLVLKPVEDMNLTPEFINMVKWYMQTTSLTADSRGKNVTFLLRQLNKRRHYPHNVFKLHPTEKAFLISSFTFFSIVFVNICDFFGSCMSWSFLRSEDCVSFEPSVGQFSWKLQFHNINVVFAVRILDQAFFDDILNFYNEKDSNVRTIFILGSNVVVNTTQSIFPNLDIKVENNCSILEL